MSILIRSIDLRVMANDVQPIIDESRIFGFNFINRLYSDWKSGANRFDDRGEQLAGLFEEGLLKAVAGLNRDPFTDDFSVGRIRHVYLLEEWRRLGFGRMLVEHLTYGVAHPFTTVRLRSSNRTASAFYEKLGFTKITYKYATHLTHVPRRPASPG